MTADHYRMKPQTIVYEVSRRPYEKHRTLSVSNAQGLRTPSGVKIPPAWTDIWMTTDPKSHIQAIGRDSKGRRVYLYSVEHMGRAAAAKFSRLKAFSAVYPRLIKKLQMDKRKSEEALVLYLIAKSGFRIGSHTETHAAVQAFGASTLRCSQVNIEGDKISFDFIGKKGIRVNKVLKDTFLAREIGGRCQENVEKSLFNTTAEAIRVYLSTIPQGAKFTVKDFRTYLGTLTAYKKIKELPLPRNGWEYKKLRKEVGEKVAKELGNSTGIALSSYISPEVFCDWESRLPEMLNKNMGKKGLKSGFFECIHYDQEVPMEDYKDADPLEKLE